jgi:hypothetical protein
LPLVGGEGDKAGMSRSWNVLKKHPLLYRTLRSWRYRVAGWPEPEIGLLTCRTH